MRNLKKHIIAILMAVIMMAPCAMNAQIYISLDVEDDYENPRLATDSWSGLVVPLNGTDNDQYVPLGEGMWLLVGLGSFYLIRKRKKEDE